MDAKETKELIAGLKKFRKNDLDEVKADAKFNYMTRLREQEAKRQYEEAKAKGPEAVAKLAELQLEEFKGPAKKGK